MKRLAAVLFPASAAAALVAIAATLPAPASAGAPMKFVGAPTCGTSSCHGNAKGSNEMKTWSDKDPHSSAFEKLSEEKGVKIAKAVGVENAEEDAKCIGCHATAGELPADRKEKTVLAEDGVGCESCHGAGGSYKDEKHQKDPAWAKANGMLDLASKDVRKGTCDTCHGKIDEKMVAAGHPKASAYDEREAAYAKFAHWKIKK